MFQMTLALGTSAQGHTFFSSAERLQRCLLTHFDQAESELNKNKMNKLKWMGHSATIMGIQCALLNDDKSCEVNLATQDGASERAHLYVLCTCSSLMRNLLKDLPPGQQATIILPDIRGDLLESILSFIYVGETSLPSDSLTEFMEALSLLGIKAPVKFKCIPNRNFQFENSEFFDEAFDIGEEEPEDEDDNDEKYSWKNKTDEEEMLMHDDEEVITDPLNSSVVYTDAEIDEAENENDGIDDEDDGDVFDIMEMEVDSKTKLKPKPCHEGNKKVKRPPSKKRRKTSNETIEGEDGITDALELAADAVIRLKLSLQKAADRYDISKTVLWRRVRNCPEYIRVNRKNPMLSEAHKRLKKGHSLKSICTDLNIPMSTLHRHKMRMVADGQLPEYGNDSRRDNTPKDELNEKLAKALHACIHDGMTVNHSAILFEIPKSTLWRHLQRQLPNKGKRPQKKRRQKESK